VLAALALPACARSQTVAGEAGGSSQEPSRPLAALAAQKLVVAPVQLLRDADSLGWTASAGGSREYLRQVDGEIELAMKDRGVEGMWVFADQLARTAKRNVGYAPDPYSLAVRPLRPGRVKKRRDMLPEPLASQLRSLVAFTDARYILLPVEMRFERDGGTGRAVMHLVLVDARLSRPMWAIEVASDSTSSFSPAVATTLAGHLADLVAAP
jgi:hypothetical protein